MLTPACQSEQRYVFPPRLSILAAQSDARSAGGIDSKTSSICGGRFGVPRTHKELPKHAAEDEETTTRDRDRREDCRPVPLVRPPSGGGRGILRIPLPGFACRQGRRSACGLPEREKGRRPVRRIHPDGPKVQRPEWGRVLQVQR